MSATACLPVENDSLSEMLFEALAEVHVILGKPPEVLVLSQEDYERLRMELGDMGYLSISCTNNGPGTWCGVPMVVSEDAGVPYFSGKWKAEN